MKRKGSLAVDLMTTQALWDLLYGDALSLVTALEGGMQIADRQLRTRRVLLVVKELRTRGIQLSMHWE
jgi:hypothetical protein